MQKSSKINIISNIIIKKASQTSIQDQPLSQPSCTFEELLLRKIQQDKKDTNSTKKKRVTKGAEVITAAIGKEILKEMKKLVKTKTTKKLKKKTKINKNYDSAILMHTAQEQEEQPGPSGIKHKNKRKRQPSLDSITSVSDIMSEHSDSDIIDCVQYEELMDEYFEDDFNIHNEEPRSQIKDKMLNMRK